MSSLDPVGALLQVGQNLHHLTERREQIVGDLAGEHVPPTSVSALVLDCNVMPTRLSVAADLERELLTATDFIEWLTPERFADLIDGEIFVHAAVSIRHADLLNFLDGVLRAYIDRRQLGVLHRETVAVRLSARNVFLSDLAFYRAGRESRIRDTHLEGAPDFVVEV